MFYAIILLIYKSIKGKYKLLAPEEITDRNASATLGTDLFFVILYLQAHLAPVSYKYKLHIYLHIIVLFYKYSFQFVLFLFLFYLQHPEFSFLLKERVCPLVIKLFSPSLKYRPGAPTLPSPSPMEKPYFPIVMRLLRIVAVLIKHYYSLLVSNFHQYIQ